MTDNTSVERRLDAVERTLADGDVDLSELQTAGDLADRVATVEDELAALEQQVADLEAANQALRGYVGNVRSVNEDVEQRADAAIAAVDRLERRIDEPATADASHSGTESERDHSRDHERPSRQRGDDDAVGTTNAAGQRRDRCDACGRPRKPNDRERDPNRRRDGGHESDAAGDADSTDDGRSLVDRVRDAL